MSLNVSGLSSNSFSGHLNRLLWAVGLSIVFWGESNLYAAVPPATGGANEISFKWQGSDYQPLGQEGFLGKGNETLSLQALYILNKLHLLDQGFQEGKDGMEEVLKNELPDFCLETELGGNAGARECFKRYKAKQILNLNEIRYALSKNKESRYELDSQSVEMAILEYEKPGEAKKPKKATMPYVPTVADLEKQLNSDPSRYRIGARGDSDQWVAQLMNRPEESQFVEWESILKDPKDPSAGSWMRAKRENGKIKIDQKAYDAAVNVWKSGISDDKGQLIKEYRKQFRKPDYAKHGSDKFEIKNMTLSMHALIAAREAMVGAADDHTSKRQALPQTGARGGKTAPGAPFKSKGLGPGGASADASVGTNDISRYAPPGYLGSGRNPAQSSGGRDGALPGAGDLKGVRQPTKGGTGTSDSPSGKGARPTKVPEEKSLDPKEWAGANNQTKERPPLPNGEPDEGLYLSMDPDTLKDEIKAVQIK